MLDYGTRKLVLVLSNPAYFRALSDNIYFILGKVTVLEVYFYEFNFVIYAIIIYYDVGLPF
jgi:hypothetical protein